MSHLPSDQQLIQAILLLRLSEASVNRALKVCAQKPTERTLMALGACLYRLEERHKCVDYMTAENGSVGMTALLTSAENLCMQQSSIAA